MEVAGIEGRDSIQDDSDNGAIGTPKNSTQLKLDVRKGRLNGNGKSHTRRRAASGENGDIIHLGLMDVDHEDQGAGMILGRTSRGTRAICDRRIHARIVLGTTGVQGRNFS